MAGSEDDDISIASAGSAQRKSLRRTISIDSLAPSNLLKTTNSFTRLFQKGNKRKLDDTPSASNATSEYESDETENSDEQTTYKKQKTLTEADLELQKKEEEWDSLLPAEYRKYRPKGHKLNPPPTDRPIRIYADGVFDLFHLGHMRQLEQAKKCFPNVELVCAIPNDVETHKRKGLTVLTDKQRYETLRHCKWVDEVIEDAPWVVTLEYLKEHKIDYVAHDDLPYVADGIEDIYLPMKQEGMFLATQRTEGISTSDIITKIIRDYDKYLMRNLARGATRKELNVSWLKKNELDLKKQISEFRHYFKKSSQNLNRASTDLYFEVREFLRGKNSSSKELGLSTSPSFDSSSSFLKRLRSPATDFASKYNGNEHMRSRSIIDNFKEWMTKDIADSSEISDSHLDEDEDEDEFETSESHDEDAGAEEGHEAQDDESS
ncbi:unnamed protein product [Kuraishia capsulata CBS 1993]|uniref:choline-phosphate cytidylyltransferase n=1 Tax=Kuraishia capsulata CBS 1993 TaxID=1382522 RepID=W6MV30_9ASCO|nr:uncharacterized protein KUCA_T00002006001 [Kuraishia capsulata CBS 1993]CDK26035.1 unnamed protein product [Kuraishia capsulata CBS 1993]